jgi:hypothetical protein
MRHYMLSSRRYLIGQSASVKWEGDDGIVRRIKSTKGQTTRIPCIFHILHFFRLLPKVTYFLHILTIHSFLYERKGKLGPYFEKKSCGGRFTSWHTMPAAFSRRDSDTVLHWMLENLEINKVSVYIIYRWIRLFGWMEWK